MGGWVALFDANEWNNFLFNENILAKYPSNRHPNDSLATGLTAVGRLYS
jgi:hypothetical protein